MTDTTQHPAVQWLANEYLPTVSSLNEAERRLGISEKTLRALMRGNYEGNTAKQLAKLTEQMELHRQRAAVALQGTQYIQTDTMRRVWNTCAAAKAAHLLNFVVGVSQIGKTTAARAFKEKYPETTVLLEILSPRPTISSVVRDLAELLHIPGRVRTIDATIRALRAAITPRHLVIVDEAHTFLDTPKGVEALNFLRRLFDLCGCGCVLLFTDLDGNVVTHSDHAAKLGQLKRRGLREILPEHPSPDDVRAIWTAFDLPDPDRETERTVGALVRRSCFGELLARIRLAAAEAQRGGVGLSWAHFNAALRRMEGQEA